MYFVSAQKVSSKKEEESQKKQETQEIKQTQQEIEQAWPKKKTWDAPTKARNAGR